MRPAFTLYCLIGLGAGLAGCDARFTDLRPQLARDGAAAAALGDARDLADAGDLAGADLAAVDLAAADPVLARGTFVGRAGHGGMGGAELYRRGDGRVALRFLADFRVTGQVGPVVVLTSRADLGNSLTAEDLELGDLTAAAGAQEYLLPGSDGGRRNAFVWCRPFRVEIAKAPLEAPR